MLTDDEQAFLSRVAIHMADHGLDPADASNIETACRAVLARDEELWLMVAGKTDEGKFIASTLCETVYHRARQRN